MLAARIHAYGPPEVFAVEEAPRPSCGPDDVLIEVVASSVNPVDCKIRQGYQRAVVRRTLPTILGMDVSGVVAEVGASVTAFKPGDAVYASPNHRRDGTYAQFVAVRADEVALKPPSLSHAQAAAIPLAGLTAWQALAQAADVQPGQRVFIEAGAGGVGTFAIQIARHLGAHVSTTCSARNTELVTELGAHEAINYREVRFEEVLPPQDAALEALGGDSKRRILEILKPGGRLISINSDLPAMTRRFGPHLGVVAAGSRMACTVTSALIRNRVRLRPVVRRPDGADLARLTELVEQGALRPVIDREFPLAQIAEAHQYSEDGHARGKIIIRLRDDP